MIKTITVKRWMDILKLEPEFPLEYYRGQADAHWTLSSSLYRSLKERDLLDGASNKEFWMLRHFVRGAARYISDRPNSNDYIGWLSLMQHHGAPTRLVDFTQSFYVACYFALIDAMSDAAVWSVDPFFLFQVAENSFNVKCEGLRDQWDDMCTNCGNQFLSSILSSADVSEPESIEKGVIAVHPFTLHTRLAAQQGLFLMPMDVELDLLENLRPFHKKGTFPITKIILKEEMRAEGLAHLREMNITAETLFPGIDGFAKSLFHRTVL